MVPHRIGALQRYHRQQDAVHQSVGQAQAAKLAPHLLPHMGRHLVPAIPVIQRYQPPDGGGTNGAVYRLPTTRGRQSSLHLVR